MLPNMVSLHSQLAASSGDDTDVHIGVFVCLRCAAPDPALCGIDAGPSEEEMVAQHASDKPRRQSRGGLTAGGAAASGLKKSKKIRKSDKKPAWQSAKVPQAGLKPISKDS